MDAHRARALLAEISHERLDQFLLANYRAGLTERGHYLGIDPLDGLIHPFLKTSPTPAPAPDSTARFPLIEVAGLGPCSGKTQLLYRIAAGLLLGSRGHAGDLERSGDGDGRGDADISHEGDESHGEHGHQRSAAAEAATSRSPGPGLGHRPGIVVWLDCSGHFDIRRLAAITADVEAARGPSGHAGVGSTAAPDLADIPHRSGEPAPHSPTVVEALQALLVDRSSSFDALLHAVEALPDTLLADPPLSARYPGLAQMAVAAVIVSSIDTFLPLERAASASAETELRRTAAGVGTVGAVRHSDGDAPDGVAHTTHPPKPYTQLEARYSQLVAALRRVQARLGCVVVAGRRASGHAPAGGQGVLPGAWQRAVDVWVRIERREQRALVPAHADVLQALKTREAQDAAEAASAVQTGPSEQARTTTTAPTRALVSTLDDEPAPDAGTRAFDVSVAGRGRARADRRLRLLVGAQSVRLDEHAAAKTAETHTERERADG